MWREERHSSYFVYHPDYLNNPIEPFPLMAPMKGAINRTFHSDTARMNQRLPAFWQIVCLMIGVMPYLSNGE